MRQTNADLVRPASHTQGPTWGAGNRAPCRERLTLRIARRSTREKIEPPTSFMPIALKLISQPLDPKPAKRVRMRVKEKEAFVPEGEPTVSPPKPEAPVGANHRILVADDNPVVLRAFELKLKNLGFQVSTTGNPETVASMVEREKAELVILDINFGSGGAIDWNGFNVLQWLRRFPELAGIPVIFITGSEAPQFKDKALAGGAAGFFQKPVDFNELLQQILQVLPEPKHRSNSPMENTSSGAN